MKIEKVADHACKCGEGPVWHKDEQKLYWADIPNGRLFRYDPANGEHELVLEDRPPGAILVQEDGALLLLRDRGNVVRFRDGRLETVIETIEGEGTFNDAIADPAGRVFSGTCAQGREGSPGEYEQYGRLYRIDPDGSHRVVREQVICSNGLGFSLDNKRMYFTDSTLYSIFVFDYDEATGNIGNRRVFAKTEEPAVPDGMTVDAEDHVWSAHWGGACVTRYDPDGNTVQKIEMPTSFTSSVTFGGPELDEIYVTTAGGDDKEKNGPDAGALFRITGAGVRGRAEFRSDL